MRATTTIAQRLLKTAQSAELQEAMIKEIQAIIEDFKTPIVVKSINVKPAEVTRVQSRAEIKKVMAARPRQKTRVRCWG